MEKCKGDRLERKRPGESNVILFQLKKKTCFFFKATDVKKALFIREHLCEVAATLESLRKKCVSG